MNENNNNEFESSKYANNQWSNAKSSSARNTSATSEYAKNSSVGNASATSGYTQNSSVGNASTTSEYAKSSSVGNASVTSGYTQNSSVGNASATSGYAKSSSAGNASATSDYAQSKSSYENNKGSSTHIENTSTEFLNTDSGIKENHIQSEKGHLGKTSEKKEPSFIINLAAILVLIIGAIWGFNVFKESQSPNKFITKFEDAIWNRDYDYLMSIMKFNDSSLMLTNEEIRDIVSYYVDNSSMVSKTVQSLTGVSDSTRPFNLLTEKGMLKTKYFLTVNPRYFVINSEYLNVNIELYRNGELIIDSLDNGDIIGPFIPGIYEFIISTLGEAEQFSESVYVDAVFSDSITEVDFLVEKELYDVTLLSSEPDAMIYINNERIGKTISEQNYLTGLEYNTIIYGVVVRDGQAYKSYIETVTGNGNINLIFDIPAINTTVDEVVDSLGNDTVVFSEDDLEDVVSGYLRNFSTAINDNAFYLIEPYLVKGSEIYNEQESYIPKIYNRGIKEEFLKYDILDVTYDANELAGTVKVYEVYNIIKPENDFAEECSYVNEYEFEYDEKTGRFLLTKLNF